MKRRVVPSTHTSLKLQLRRATLHCWPAGPLECLVQPIPNVPNRITVVPSTNTSLKLQLRRATLHWPAGPLECLVQPIPNVPNTITIVPSTNTSLKLQLRRATLHYWPAGALKFQLQRTTLHYWPAGAPQCIVQPVLDIPDKITVVPSTRRPLSSGTGHARASPDLVTVLGLTDCKPLACPLLGNICVYTHICMYIYICICIYDVL